YACCPHAQAESKFVNLRFHQRWTSVLSADRMRPVRATRILDGQTKSTCKLESGYNGCTIQRTAVTAALTSLACPTAGTGRHPCPRFAQCALPTECRYRGPYPQCAKAQAVSCRRPAAARPSCASETGPPAGRSCLSGTTPLDTASLSLRCGRVNKQPAP